MKKKLIKLFVVCLAIWCVYICQWSLILFLFSYCMTFVSKRKLAHLKERFPNWEIFNRNLKRNYDFAVIGNSLGYNVYNKLPCLQNGLCWALPDQQFYMQKQVISHFFSIIKQTGGGKIVQVTSRRELMEMDRRKVLSFHYSILHPWLYPDNHKRKKMLPYLWMLHPIWFLKIQHVNFLQYNKSNGEALSSNLLQIKETALFCTERNIDYVLVYIGQIHEEVLKQLNDMHIPAVDFRIWSEKIQLEYEHNRKSKEKN